MNGNLMHSQHLLGFKSHVTTVALKRSFTDMNKSKVHPETTRGRQLYRAQVTGEFSLTGVNILVYFKLLRRFKLPRTK